MPSSSALSHVSDANLELAIKNVAEFGDTDVFPYPLENHWFYDEPTVVRDQLIAFRDDPDAAFQKNPVFYSTELANAGYLGYRPATQIDPLWNAFFLASVLSIAPGIESKRQADDRVFSYRFSPDAQAGSLFSPVGWKDFQQKALELAGKCGHVGIVDVSDFYPRVYHHRLENVLRSVCACDGSVVGFLDRFLRDVNSGKSFGLPVGGPAARILAEALLIRTDQLLATRRVEYLRFVDDCASGNVHAR